MTQHYLYHLCDICIIAFWPFITQTICFQCCFYRLLHIEVRLLVLLCAVKTVEGDFRFCWTISPNVGQTHKKNPTLVRIFLYNIYIEWCIQKEQQNYTNIDRHKSVHFAVPRTETRLKMHQICIWNTGHMQSIAGPVHASAVWTDEKKTKKKTKKKQQQQQQQTTTTTTLNCSYRIFIVCRSPVSPVFWARILLS